MKKYIVTRLVVLVLMITGVLLTVGAFGMLNTAYTEFNNEAIGQISQVEEILSENDEEAAQVQEELKEDFLIRANAAAYMIQYNQNAIYDIEELERITELLQIDEIHLFTPEGEIYSGNVPEYYGFTFDSGEQMSFFMPLLGDYDLELAQDVTPNTAEEKEMQYVAVWSKDKQHIVQIGIEPLRLLEAMEATEISYVFSRLAITEDSAFFAIDATSGEIISSTEKELKESNLTEMGLADFAVEDVGETQKATFNGENGQVLLLQQSENIYIGYYQSDMSIYGSTLINIALLIAISLVVALLIIVLIYFMLDRIVLRRLLELGAGMEKIASGNLEYEMEVAGLPEFETLSGNVNFMVKQIVESSRKFSTIFEYVNVPIAMYECKSDTVIVTGKLVDILQIESDRLTKDLKSPENFLEFIEEIMSNPHPTEKDLYIISNNMGHRYIKIMRYQDGESDWGLIVDSTDEINEKNTIKQERDIDFLTGLYGKRAFFEQLETLSHKSDIVKKAAVIMFDLDNLKYVNDTWGHATGDNFISAAANILQSCEYEEKISGRLSGDEFAMILYGAENYSQLDIQIEQIKGMFDQTYIETPSDGEHKVSASIGYAIYPEQARSFLTCLKFADKAMYIAKRKCKGSVEKYNPDVDLRNNLLEEERA